MQTEHLDVNDGYGHMYVAWNEPAVEPPGECLPHTEIWRRLARAMGLTEPALYDDDLTLARTLVESGDPTLEGITVERLRREGWARLGHPAPLTPFAHGFPTPSGRMRLPEGDPYLPPAEGAAPGEDRLALIAGASHWFLNSMFANAPSQLRRAGAPAVALHPDDAEARGLADGDEVEIGNERGSFRATPRDRPDGPARRRRHHEGPLAEAAGGRRERQRRDRGARLRHRRRRGVPRLLRLGPGGRRCRLRRPG